MQRYQVYFQPETVDFFDWLATQTGLTRSRLMQETLDSMVIKVKALMPTKTKKTGSLLDLAGCLSIKGKKKTNFATESDIKFFGK